MGESMMPHVAIVTSVSEGTPWASIVMPSRLEYGIRHNATIISIPGKYPQCVVEVLSLARSLLEFFDLVWTLGADCLITNHTVSIGDVPELGPHMTICEELLGSHTTVNADSIVWRATDETKRLLDYLVTHSDEWLDSPFMLQCWIRDNRQSLADVVTVAHARAFNSVDHGKCFWEPGDLVYHPCGAPTHQRCEALRHRLQDIVR
jgi:hypothetical protein